MRISDWSSDVCSSDLVDDLDIVALTHRDQILFTQSTHDAGQGFRRKHEMVGDVAARHRQRDVGVVAHIMFPDLTREHHYEERRDPLMRSEEHTSELQSLMRISYAVFCLKKKKSYK